MTTKQLISCIVGGIGIGILLFLVQANQSQSIEIQSEIYDNCKKQDKGVEFVRNWWEKPPKASAETVRLNGRVRCTE